MMAGASLYAPGRCVANGAALESGMHHSVLKREMVWHLVNVTDFFFSKSSWLVVWVCWRMAGGEQCASTNELWSGRW